MRKIGPIVLALVFAAITSHSEAEKLRPNAGKPPYPPSPKIAGVRWDFSTLKRLAPGSDLWPITWADDGNLYAAWGDGGGFGGTNADGRVSLGVGLIRGIPPDIRCENIWGGKNPRARATFPGKSNGLLCVDGILYMGVVEQGKWLRLKIARSKDHGRSWDFASKGWDFAEPDGAFSDVTFLQFGRDYRGARDDYVYVYSQDKRASAVGSNMKTFSVAMFRTPRDRIADRNAYEYFAGLDGDGKPTWTKKIERRKAVFADPNGVGWGVRVSYVPGLKRYLLTAWHDDSGGWGIFDAPEPWGPWTTVAYYDRWIDSTFKFGFTFNQKWMSDDGKTAWMVFSGTGKYDAFNIAKGRFILRQERTGR